MNRRMVLSVEILLITFLLVFIGESTAVVGAADVTPGSDPGAIPKCAVRYKSFDSGADREIYLGLPDLSCPPGTVCERVEIDVVWQSSNTVDYTYNPASGIQTTIANTGIDTYSLSYPSVGPLGLGPLNYVEILVKTDKPGTTVEFNSVTINGISLGNFSSVDGEGDKYWMVKGVDLTDGFTFGGTIVLTGAMPSSEHSKVQITAGYVPSLTITTSSLPPGTLLSPYSQTLTATGGVPPYNWSVSGTLPNGLTINHSNGTISGTPTLSGTFNFTAQVTDAESSEAFRNLSITTESLPVRYGDPGDPINYDYIIQSAYDHCVDGYIIQVQAIELPGDFFCDQDVEVTLQGGFDEYYTDITGHTVIQGRLIIQGGRVVLENIVVR
jgi:hypothetical protein